MELFLAFLFFEVELEGFLDLELLRDVLLLNTLDLPFDSINPIFIIFICFLFRLPRFFPLFQPQLSHFPFFLHQPSQKHFFFSRVADFCFYSLFALVFNPFGLFLCESGLVGLIGDLGLGLAPFFG